MLPVLLCSQLTPSPSVRPTWKGPHLAEEAMLSQAIPWKPVLPPPAGPQIPPGALGLRQAQLRLSAGLQGRSGVSEPAGASSPPLLSGLPQHLKGLHSASYLAGPVEGKLGRSRVGGACSWGQG